MEKKHTCKLCSRGFSNGRALGGHMRSHVTATAKKTIQHSSSSPSPSASSPNHHNDDDDVDTNTITGLGYGLRENPRKSIRLSDPEFSSSSTVIVHDLDSESETESSLAAPLPHRRRSKRARPSEPEPEPVRSHSSVGSDTTAKAEDDVAISLMLLSRDIWTNPTTSEFEAEAVNGSSKYECGSCKKVFGSYQALGGHRASQKKKTTNGCSKKAQIFDDNARCSIRHECPVCYRVFGSGQALGGHKRSHMIHNNNNNNNNSVVVIRRPPPPSPLKLIDLNLPAPLEEDAEASVVSDAEFIP